MGPKRVWVTCASCIFFSSEKLLSVRLLCFRELERRASEEGRDQLHSPPPPLPKG